MIEERKMAAMQKCLQIPVQMFMQKGAEAECFAVREKARYRCRQQHWRVAKPCADLYADLRAVLRAVAGADGCAEKMAAMQKPVQILLQKRLQEYVQNGGTKRWQDAAMLHFVPIRLGKIQNCTDAERFAEYRADACAEFRAESYAELRAVFCADRHSARIDDENLLRS